MVRYLRWSYCYHRFNCCPRHCRGPPLRRILPRPRPPLFTRLVSTARPCTAGARRHRPTFTFPHFADTFVPHLDDDKFPNRFPIDDSITISPCDRGFPVPFCPCHPSLWVCGPRTTSSLCLANPILLHTNFEARPLAPPSLLLFLTSPLRVDVLVTGGRVGKKELRGPLWEWNPGSPHRETSSPRYYLIKYPPL